jgi:hypothetical protein
MNIDFADLAVGTRLNNQFSGVGFQKYQVAWAEWPSIRQAAMSPASTTAQVASSSPRAPDPHFDAAALGDTARGSPPRPGVTMRREPPHSGCLTPTGESQLAQASANVTAAAGFGTALTVTVATPQIASAVLDAVNDPDRLALVAVHDITYEQAPPGGVPDFALDGPLRHHGSAGASPIDVPIVIRRLDGSTGGIGFLLSPLPAGVSAALLAVSEVADVVDVRRGPDSLAVRGTHARPRSVAQRNCTTTPAPHPRPGVRQPLLWTCRSPRSAPTIVGAVTRLPPRLMAVTRVACQNKPRCAAQRALGEIRSRIGAAASTPAAPSLNSSKGRSRVLGSRMSRLAAGGPGLILGHPHVPASPA